ncbi:MAG: hypothetical protein JNM76_14775 [Betaproteobacteria bacterium]|nr:hypothetical protein [Betaproteobacteria bacterium]
MSLFIEHQFSPVIERYRHAFDAINAEIEKLALAFASLWPMRGGMAASGLLGQLNALQPGVFGSSLVGGAWPAWMSFQRPSLLEMFGINPAARRHQKHRAYMHRRSRYLKKHRYPPKDWA